MVGASGSGKSTVIALIERFYDPLEGSVLLDGIDIRELNIKWLRGQIGLVSQEPVLFATTIKGNVAHGLIGTKWEHAPEEKKFALIKEACTKANADGFISKMPLGYDTVVGERGFLLSGGQKQRIAIARAIVSDPCILLLDEATSALDTQSEGIVQDALDKAAAGRTTITIAHRLSTIKHASIIYVMGDGFVLEAGTHDELLGSPNGHYARLVQAQKFRETEERDEQDFLLEDEEQTKGALAHEYSKEALDELPLGRKKSGRSLSSELADQKSIALAAEEGTLGIFYIFRRFFILQSNVWKHYVVGAIFAACEYCISSLRSQSSEPAPVTGLVYPGFGIVYSLAINSFQDTSDHDKLRHDGDRNALWFFIIALLSMCAIGISNYSFASAAAHLTQKLRSLSFKSILRQDIGYFDEDKHSVGEALL